MFTGQECLLLHVLKKGCTDKIIFNKGGKCKFRECLYWYEHDHEHGKETLVQHIQVGKYKACTSFKEGLKSQNFPKDTLCYFRFHTDVCRNAHFVVELF